MSRTREYPKQIAVAREVMARRSAALREMAGLEQKIDVAERIMREDEEILRKLSR